MHRVQAGPVVGAGAVLVLLGVLGRVPGLGPAAWAVGAGCGAGLGLLLARALRRRGAGAGRPATLGPADRITLLRGVLACGVAALTCAHPGRGQVVAIVALAATVVVLDGVDGRVARRTGTASDLGARFDLEVDAFLILALSGYVARDLGAWVLLIGAARYLFVAARRVLPWLRGQAPPRPWCKVVAVVQAVALVVAVADVVPDPWMQVVLVVALGLLAESFGRETWELWRAGHPGAGDSFGSVVVTVVAGAALWVALVVPDRARDLSLGTFLRIPVEGLVLVGLALVLPARTRRVVASVAGLLLGALVVVRALDMGFFVVFDRPFDLLNDWYYLAPGVGVLGDSVGRPVALAAAVLAGLVAVAVLVGCCLAAVRLTRVAAGHRRGSARTVTALAVVWVLCAVGGVGLASGSPVASRSTADLAYDQVHQLRADLADRKDFARQIAHDDLAGRSGLLDGLHGKDVLVVFVESYGRVALERSSFAPGVTAVLDDGTRRLQRAGYRMRSAFLTSPTFGAGSWLAHATLQSGLWVDSQQRYNQLMTAPRLTLTEAFGRAGWRTVFDVPANTHDWAEGHRFYHYDQLYDSRDVGYHGPRFGYAAMPDQYTLAALRGLELTPDPDRRPVMAEVDLVSSHHPWTPLPRLVDWDEVGDGSVFDGMQDQAASGAYEGPDEVRVRYGRSIEYTMSTLVSWLEHDPADRVLVVLGDHQPHSYVSGSRPGRDVPITVLARDPAVIDRIDGWGWQDGLHPSPDAPVWRMDTFRDRFLSAFSSG